MKLDVSCMRYLGKEEYRVLTAIEAGMRNHELVVFNMLFFLSFFRHILSVIQHIICRSPSR